MTHPRTSDAIDSVGADVRALLEVLVRVYHYDFRGYAAGSLRRRVLSAVRDLGLESIAHLSERVAHDPAVFGALLSHLTVQVSSLFRDPALFAVVRERVVPVLTTYPSIRIWVAGCATGEEAYSLAILLEEAGVLERSVLYATDINPLAVSAAARGVYPMTRFDEFRQHYEAAGGTRNLLDYGFTDGTHLTFHRHLRQRIMFSDHCLVTDHVFAEAQLVTCRNVLIYFERAQQRRAVELFTASLVPRGFLWLGSHETLPPQPERVGYDVVDRRARLYRRSLLT